MMKNKLILAASLLALTFGVSCKKAKYEFTKDDKNKGGPDQPIADPNANQSNQNLPANQFKGAFNFEMKGTPTNGKVGENITFEGRCGDNAKESLTWQFGDGQNKNGNKVVHQFKESRKYVIDASCKGNDGKERRGSIIIYIAPSANGSSNPNQNSPGQSSPGQR